MTDLLQTSSITELRQQAEAILQEKTAQSPEQLKALSPEALEELFHELHVHQIELELQNEELRQAQLELNTAKASYFDLYDLAPVGYLTICKNGLISQANLAVATLLGLPRRELINKRLSSFIVNDDLDRYYPFRNQVFECNEPQMLDLRMLNNDSIQFWVHMDASVAQGADGIPNLRMTLTNITELKEAEQSLAESEKLLRTIFDATPDAMLISDEQGIISKANQQAVCLLGYPINELIGLSIEALLPEPFRAMHPAQREQFAASGASRSKASRPGLKALRKDGREVDVDISFNAIQTEQGLFYISALRDITEQHRMLEALATSEKEFRWLAESMPQIVWVTRADGWNTYFNQQWVDYTGLTFEESQGHGWIKPFHPDDRKRTWDAWQNAVNNIAKYSLECRLRRTDGIYRWWLIRGEPVVDQNGKVYKWFGTSTDIHEIKETEHKLRNKERLLAESQRVARIGSWSTNLTTGYVDWSDEMFNIYGVAPESFNNSVDAFLNVIHPDDLVLMGVWLSDCMAGKNMQEIDFRVILPDNTVRFIRGSGGLEYDENEKPFRMVGTAQDITERKHLEQLEKQHLDELAHVTRLGLMGEMASGIAHEINQPLTAISSYAQVSLNLINGEKPDLAAITDVLSKTQQQALRAGRIIKSLREFTKPNPQRLMSNINTLIGNCVDLCQSEIKQNGIELKFELEDDLPSVNINSIQIEQVLLNLIKNGCDVFKALPVTQQRRLTIRSRLTTDNSIRVEVKDSGTGLCT